MKTIKSLINPDKKVYVKMNSADDCKRFFSLAEKEGLLFCDGAKGFLGYLPDFSLKTPHGATQRETGAKNLAEQIDSARWRFYGFKNSYASITTTFSAPDPMAILPIAPT